LSLDERSTVADLESIREISWIVRARAGDREAFMALVRAYERRLLFFIRRFERDPNRALDVLQEVWMSVWKTIGALRKPEAFRTWLYRIAHGAVVGAIRAEQRRREIETDLRDPPTQRPQLAPELQAVDTADLLHHALDRLSPEHRTVVLMRFLEDMTIDEIADAAGVPAGTVKSRLHYAKQVLHTAIEEQNHGTQN
jgi:RNA polymerase sigma-70 factor (ECF subfamily)